MGLSSSHYPESYAAGITATGRVSHDGQFKGDDPDKRRIPWSSRMRVGSGVESSIP
jgi:hypothetical protein